MSTPATTTSTSSTSSTTTSSTSTQTLPAPSNYNGVEVDLNQFVSIYDFEKAAKKTMLYYAFEYVDSGAADEVTSGWNVSAYQNLKLQTRVLRDLSNFSMNINVLDTPSSFPLLITPFASHKLMHPDGELATVQGAQAAGVPFVVGNFTNYTLEQIHEKAPDVPLWFQFYMHEDTGYMTKLVKAATDNNCKALVITADTPSGGARDRQEKVSVHGFPMPYADPKNAGVQPVTWEQVKWLLDNTDIPIVLKGILHPEDADYAISLGVKGISVSNHGARNLDTLPATIDVLPSIVKTVKKRVPVFVDGGIRRGTDIMKAVALGADAVFVGKPVAYSLGVAGAAGVAKALNILKKELEEDMKLCGKTSLADLDETLFFQGTTHSMNVTQTTQH